MSPEEVFRELVRAVAAGDADALPGLYARDTVVTHPMHPDRVPALRGRAQLAEHFRAGLASVADLDFAAEDIVIQRCADPEVIIAEFAYRGTNRKTGVPFAIRNVFIMRIRDGEIIESRDYADHAAFVKARAGGIG